MIVSLQLKDDKEVCMAAVAQNGPAYKACSVVMKQDPEIALAAVC
jgi:hypothetical protein